MPNQVTDRSVFSGNESDSCFNIEVASCKAV